MNTDELKKPVDYLISSQSENEWIEFKHNLHSVEEMTNQSLRSCFDIDDKNYAIASRIIKATIAEGLIKDYAPDNSSKKYASYLPYWA